MGCCLFAASTIDPEAAAASVWAECPEILIEGEEFSYAFAYLRDQIFFTNCRVLVKDKQGLTGTSISWKSIPYSAIRAFYIETAGMLELDVLLGFWPDGISQGSFDRYSPMPSQAIEVNLRSCDLYSLQRHLCHKIFSPDKDEPVWVCLTPTPAEDASFSKFLDLIGGDARSIDPKMVESQLKVEPPILMPDETVDMAFKCGRDTTCFTSKRLLHINVMGMTGKRIRYTTYPWESIKAWSIRTAGRLDRDSDLTVWTCIGHVEENKFTMDFRDSAADILAVNRYLSDRLLGRDESPPSRHAAPCAGMQDEGGGWQAWLAGDSRQIDAVEANRRFHEEFPVLQGSETCEMAFKAARDFILFTTKRLVLVDVQGVTGLKISYTSVPWQCVQVFGLRSAGAVFDKDSEMLLWTDIFHDSRCEEDEVEEVDIYYAEPGLSHIAVDFKKDTVDLEAIARYLADRCAVLGSQSSRPPEPAPVELLDDSQPSHVERFLGWLGDDYRQCDPGELDRLLHSDCRMLLPEERVQMGFVCGRDKIALTTHRAIKIDTQGVTGRKVLYLSLPYSKLQAYYVESAGTWDFDASISLNVYAPFYNWEKGHGLDLDFGKARCDILALSQYLSAQIVGAADGSSSLVREKLPQQPEGGVSAFLNWIGDDYHQISAEDATEKFSRDPAMLLPDETVDLAFKCGRDFVLFTTKRYMRINTMGWTGQKVGYQSLPYKSLTCFYVTGAAKHPFDRDAEVCLHSQAGEWGFDVRKEQGDIMAVYSLLNRKIILEGLGDGLVSG